MVPCDIAICDPHEYHTGSPAFQAGRSLDEELQTASYLSSDLRPKSVLTGERGEPHRHQCSRNGLFLTELKQQCNVDSIVYQLSSRLKGSSIAYFWGQPASLETAVTTKRQELVEMKMLRFERGVTELDMIRKSLMRGALEVGPMGSKLWQTRLWWYGDVRLRWEESACGVAREEEKVKIFWRIWFCSI